MSVRARESSRGQRQLCSHRSPHRLLMRLFELSGQNASMWGLPAQGRFALICPGGMRCATSTTYPEIVNPNHQFRPIQVALLALLSEPTSDASGTHRRAPLPSSLTG
jgi:hypothetical protein